MYCHEDLSNNILINCQNTSRHVWSYGFKWVESTDMHLMDDQKGREGHMEIMYVEGDGFAVELIMRDDCSSQTQTCQSLKQLLQA